MSKKVKYDFSKETIEKRRTFPTWRVIVLILLLVVQVFCVAGIIFYKPTPQDRIDSYEIYIEPRADGTLDMEYKLHWTPLVDEPLEDIYIGVANPNYSIISYSDNIKDIDKQNEDDMCTMKVIFKNAYEKNQAFDFSIKINQGSILCEEDGKKFYEFIPGWFNETPVCDYSFYWKSNENIIFSNSKVENDGWLNWTGSMDVGEYRILRVEYKEFNATATYFKEFDDSGVYNGLKEDRWAFIALMSFIIVVLLVIQLHMLDCFVSYYRGRGFFHGYGHHVYIYGRRNPRYDKECARHSGSHGGRGGIGGCACACACACAGGGRAGCSQKDTYSNNNEKQRR